VTCSSSLRTASLAVACGRIALGRFLGSWIFASHSPLNCELHDEERIDWYDNLDRADCHVDVTRRDFPRSPIILLYTKTLPIPLGSILLIIALRMGWKQSPAPPFLDSLCTLSAPDWNQFCRRRGWELICRTSLLWVSGIFACKILIYVSFQQRVEQRLL
jgi:hypothetical protein